MGILSPVVRATYTKEQILELVRTANRLYDALEAQIVIAALNGAARAGAAEMSLARDEGRDRAVAAPDGLRPRDGRLGQRSRVRPRPLVERLLVHRRDHRVRVPGDQGLRG